jgi:hypothetical protein
MITIPTSLSDTNFGATIRVTKSRIKIHKDNGKYGIEFTIDKTIPKFNKGAKNCDLT